MIVIPASHHRTGRESTTPKRFWFPAFTVRQDGGLPHHFFANLFLAK
jgi:hypothetical protein